MVFFETVQMCVYILGIVNLLRRTLATPCNKHTNLLRVPETIKKIVASKSVFFLLCSCALDLA